MAQAERRGQHHLPEGAALLHGKRKLSKTNTRTGINIKYSSSHYFTCFPEFRKALVGLFT